MANYGMSVTLHGGFTETVDRTRAALAEEGFGVLTEVDVAATMKAKIDHDMAPYLILGACNPALAHQALAAEPSIGLLLPCNVVVRSLDETRTRVEAIDPGVMVNVTGNPAITSIADQTRARLQRALADLTAKEDVR